jgi:hypothetical protein
MECSGEMDGSVSCVYYEDEENEHFISTCINGNLGPFLYQYLTNVRKYAPRMVNQLLSGSLVPSIALSARDSKWDGEKYAVTTLTELSNASFLSKMTARGMDILLPEIMLAAKTNTESGGPRTGKKKFSDEAMNRVAESYNLKNKRGLNVTPIAQASNFSVNSVSTNGNESNRSVTTQDIQARMPELRITMNALKDKLATLSAYDPLFDDPIMNDVVLDDLSASSSPEDALNAVYKDTKTCITKLTVRIGELEHGRPPPRSGSAGPSSADDGGRAAAQGG